MVLAALNAEFHLGSEQALTLREAAKLSRFSYTTIHRWSKYGHNGLKLECLKFPGKVLTSIEAVERFAHRFEAMESQQGVAAMRATSNERQQLREQFGI